MSDVVRDLFDSVADDRQWTRLMPASHVVVHRAEQLKAQRRVRRRVLLVALVALLVLGQLLTSGAGWRRAEPTTPAPTPRPPSPSPPSVDLGRLQAGSPPSAMPYAIGRRIYWRGAEYFVPPTHGGPVTVVHTQPLGDELLAWVRDGDTDVVGIVGPARSWREITPAAVDVVDGNVVVVEPSVSVVDPLTGRTVAQLEPTAPGLVASASTVGHQVLVTYSWALDHTVASTVLWEPSTGARRSLPDPADPRGPWTVAQPEAGVLAEPAGTGCVRLYQLPAPLVGGRQLCSEGGYAVSADGSRAVVVRGGRLAVVSIAYPDWPPVPASLEGVPPARAGGTNELRPIGWQDATHYLAVVRLGAQLAMVRCLADGPGSCQRVVTSFVRTGVSDIVAGA